MALPNEQTVDYKLIIVGDGGTGALFLIFLILDLMERLDCFDCCSVFASSWFLECFSCDLCGEDGIVDFPNFSGVFMP